MENKGENKDVYCCLIVGSRTFTDYSLLKERTNHILSERIKEYDICIVSGGARGADTLAKRYAEEMGFNFKEFQADWDLYGKRAGYIRNRQMHEYIASFENRGVIAFWDGKSQGTAQNFGLSEEFRNPTRIVRI